MGAEAVGLADVALVHEHGDSGEQAAEPCEAGLEPVEKAEQDVAGMLPAGEENVVPGGFEFADVFELVPELGADDAGEDDHGDNVEGVGVHTVANKILMQQDCAADGSEPEEQPEGSDVSKSEIQIGIHATNSIAVMNKAGQWR